LLLTNRNSPSLNSFRLLRKPFFPFASNFFSLAQLFYVQKFYTDFINTIESLAVTTSLFLILPWWGKSRPSCEKCFRKIPASLDQSNFCFQVQGAKRKKLKLIQIHYHKIYNLFKSIWLFLVLKTLKKICLYLPWLLPGFLHSQQMSPYLQRQLLQ
jgi:hypothetical protein